MSIQKTFEKVTYLDFLIRTRSTGCAYQLAGKLKVSERTIFYYLRELRELGVPIFWS
ncbi:MAG: HTH domain-containing protein, partial [Bacteroidota bacterium]